ncbi:MAG: lamin tail domain-containing protein, partial [Verrucomicrobiae bacterium]|nr:lamin tail domain-containing protein [Verrucomicrobiae bacterium]
IALAPLATRAARFTELGRLRLQECERVRALRTELTKCGAEVREAGDTLEIAPGSLHGADIETYEDHRMAMCFAILALNVPGLRLHNPACVKKTFPNFFQKLADPDGVAAVHLRYRQDPSTTLTTVIMLDDGTAGDERAGDGVYTGTISARSSGQRVAFHIQATDTHAAAATTLFPASHPDEECVIRWGDPRPAGNFTDYHLWTTTATDSRFNAVNGLDNRWWDATLVHRDGRVIYNARFRNKASPYHGGRGDFAVTVPKDDLLLGVTDRVFAQTGNANSEETAMRGQLANWMAGQLGLPFLHAHYMQLYRNGSRYANVTEDLEQPNTYYAERWFPEGGEGDLYKVAVWFEFQDDNSNFNATSATMQNFTTLGGEQKLARYRWNWQRRANDGDANNYGQLLNLMTLANAAGAYEGPLLEAADVEQWMRVHAFNRVTGNWDAWTFSVGQNMYLYRREGQRWVIMPWDIDFVLGLGNGPTDALWGGQDPTGNRMYDTPVFRRALWRAFQDAVAGPMQAANYEPQIETRSRALAANNVSVSRDPSGIRAYLEQRRTYLQNQLRANDAAQFAITTGGGNDFATSSPLIVLTGTAPFAVAAIAVNGAAYPVRWTGHTSFAVSIPLLAPTNPVVLAGLDEDGNVLPGVTDSITVTYTGELQQPEEHLLISEIMYHPATPDTGYVEIYNRSTRTTFDLSNWVLSGTGFTFPAGTLISPRAWLLVVNNRHAFEAEFGLGKPIAGEFSGSLDNGGETLRLVRPGATPAEDLDVDVVRYDDDPPWPIEADGRGASLQVVDVTRDNWRVANWGVGDTNSAARATPGAANSVAASLPEFPLLWINEVLPENITGLTDAAGDHDPWIEIHNAGDTALDLDALYLTDDYASLLKWRLPSVVLPAKSFVVVWVDGEPGESLAGEPHASFRLPAGTGSVALTWEASGEPAVLDHVDYRLLSPDRAYGSYPDGQPRFRQVLHYPTPGAPNNPASRPVQVLINEWMAVNHTTIADPADGDFDDWFELFNAGAEPVDLTACTLSDDPANVTKALIPAGTVIQPGGFLLVWADEDSGQTVPGGDLHVNFKLSSAGEAILLHAPDGTLIDQVSFGAQTPDVSEGRRPDGGPGPFEALPVPTPGHANEVSGANLPPVLAAIGNRIVLEGNLVTFTATATDSDVPAQTLTFSLAGAPEGASIDPDTGAFSWRPDEAQGPGEYPITVWVVDDGSPVRADSETFLVTVNEVNEPPALAAIPDWTVLEGELVALRLDGSDPDLPVQTLTYTLDPGAPAGMTLDAASGWLIWPVPIDYPPALNDVTVQVTDDGNPPRSAQRTFRVTVEPALNVVINEVMYAPARTGAEFIELHNLSTSRAVDLGGLRLQGNALTFDFPAGEMIPAGGFVTVAADPVIYAADYSEAPPPAGGFSGALTPAEEHLRLLEPLEGGDSYFVWDECWFRNAAPWPTAAAGAGGSLQLVDPLQDNRRPANWDAVADFLPPQPVDLVAFDAPWRYEQSGLDLGIAWREPGYDDSAWDSGPGLLYVEGADLPEPKGTELALGQWTYYFRTTFQLAG